MLRLQSGRQPAEAVRPDGGGAMGTPVPILGVEPAVSTARMGHGAWERHTVGALVGVESTVSTATSQSRSSTSSYKPSSNSDTSTPTHEWLAH
ncbi:hypothetical protein THAOC_13227, partial [Thalassiosira oceanica]